MKNKITLTTIMKGASVMAVTLMLATSCNNTEKHDDTKMENGEQSTTLSDMDSQFLKDVKGINQEEMMLGKLAQNKAMSAETKDLGKMMEESHTTCEKDLLDLAAKKSADLSSVSDEKARDAEKDLSEKSGMDFDKKYCDMMVEGHKKAIEKFEKASTDCNDADIKAFASNTLPELHKHLEHAEMCKANCDKMK